MRLAVVTPARFRTSSDSWRTAVNKLVSELSGPANSMYIRSILTGDNLQRRRHGLFSSRHQHATFFQSLAAGAVTLEGQPKEADSVFHEIHHLLSKASEKLLGRMNPLDVLSVTGRAASSSAFCETGDIILEPELGIICPTAKELKDCFSDAEKAAATSCWLDETYNGDLLPLGADLPRDAGTEYRHKAYVKLYRKLGSDTQQDVFRYLQAILREWEPHGHSFQRRIDWGDFNFAHISHRRAEPGVRDVQPSMGWRTRKDEPYYTPKNIARCLVEEAFAGLEKPADARVLDSACGAGIFLVLSFRKLVRACWEREGRRPIRPPFTESSTTRYVGST